MRRASSLEHRIKGIASTLINKNIHLVIGHADRGTIRDNNIKQLMHDYPHVKVVSEPYHEKLPNLSRLRNIAAEAADEGVLIFIDADIYINISFLNALARQIFDGITIAIAPCIYLTAKGTRLLKAGMGFNEIIDDVLNYSPKNFTHWAFPSSVFAIKRNVFFEIGGFYEGYSGHGYEDFDFMLHLALKKKLLEPSFDLLLDCPYRAPFLAEGFRSALGAMCIHNLLKGIIFAHLYHARDNLDIYYLQRQVNARLFHARIKEIIINSNPPTSQSSFPAIIIAFYEQCSKLGIEPFRYYALFDARPRHMLIKNSIFAKIKKNFKQLLA